MTVHINTFQDLDFEWDRTYPHEKFNQPPKYHAKLVVNDYTLSIVYGGGTYSSSSPDGNATTFEVALWDIHDDPIKMGEHDTVLGWQSPDEVTRIMKLVQLRPDLLKPKTIEQLCDEAGV